MSNFQKTMKYMAMAFAVILAVGIISGIANAVFAIFSTISGGTMGNRNETIDYSQTFTEVRSLDIDNSTGKLIIKTGDSFKVEAVHVSDSFEVRMTGNGTLKISDNHNGFRFPWFHFSGFNSTNTKITVYLPADFIAEGVNINSGAGAVSVEDLHTGDFVISAGAGSINGNNMSADQVKIDGGVGSISLSEVNFTDTDLNCGVGSLNLDGVLLGRNKVNCGVGSVQLNLRGNEKDYDIDIDSGIGTIRLNGKKVSDGYKTDYNADNSIKIEGGVGNVDIDIN